MEHIIEAVIRFSIVLGERQRGNYMEQTKNPSSWLLAIAASIVAVFALVLCFGQQAQASNLVSPAAQLTPAGQTIKVGGYGTYTFTLVNEKTGKPIAGVPVTWKWTNTAGHKYVEAKISSKTTTTNSKGQATVKLKGLSNGVSTIKATAVLPASVRATECEASDVAAVTVRGAVNGTTKTASSKSSKAKYKVKTSSTCIYVKTAVKGKSATVPNTVKIYSKTYKVVGIGSKAFKGSKVKTVTVKAKSLTKKGVKNSMKSSKVKTVKVCKSKYKSSKYFSKKNAGKTVTVKKF